MHRPLDGGALSPGRARAPTRGPAAAPLRCSFLSVCGEEREGGGRNETRVWVTGTVVGFYSVEIVVRPSDRDERVRALRLDSA